MILVIFQFTNPLRVQSLKIVTDVFNFSVLILEMVTGPKKIIIIAFGVEKIKRTLILTYLSTI
jgi:hypothetical protein